MTNAFEGVNLQVMLSANPLTNLTRMVITQRTYCSTAQPRTEASYENSLNVSVLRRFKTLVLSLSSKRKGHYGRG